MKKRVVINESTIDKIMKEVINEMTEFETECNETEETVDNEEKQEDEYEHVDSVEYIVETYINGNISYAIERIKELSPVEILDLQNVAEEYGVLDKINDLIRKAYGKLNEEAETNSPKSNLFGPNWDADVDNDAWVTINSPEEGKLYCVRIWEGYGEQFDFFKVYADYEESAIEKVVAYLEKNRNADLLIDDVVEMEKKDMLEKGMSYEEIYDDIDGWAYEVNATREGAEKPHYIRAGYLEVKELPDPENSLNESKSLYNRMLKVRF